MKYKLIVSHDKFFDTLNGYMQECVQLSELPSVEIPERMNDFAGRFAIFLKKSITPSITEIENFVQYLYWEQESFRYSFMRNTEEENLKYNLEKAKDNITLLSGYIKMIHSFNSSDESLEVDTVSKKIDFVLTQLSKSFDDNFYSVSVILKLNAIKFREGESEEIVEDLKKSGYVITKEQYSSTDRAKISIKGAKYIERKNKIGKPQKIVSPSINIDSSEKINELKYFEISNQAKTPSKCPILNYCARRAYTIYYFSEYSEEARGRNVIETLKSAGQLPEDFEKKMIPIQGEQVTWSKSANLVYYNNACPEVNLFDSENALPFASNTASISGEWDNFRSNEKFKPGIYRHYSQCREYCNHIFEKKTQKKGRKRSPISHTLRFEIFQRDNFTCQYCGRSKEHKAVLVIDHIVPYSDGGKDEYSNLITSCQECNSGKSNTVI